MSTKEQRLVRSILEDIRVEIAQDVDRNFSRQGYYGQPWPKRTSPTRAPGAPLLIRTGALRRSLTGRTDGQRVVFESALAYAGIHNEGGRIQVTKRMNRFFWAMYYKTGGRRTRRKDGSLTRSKRNERLTAEASFWRSMALKPVGSYVTMPRRQFIGPSPTLEKAVEDIVGRRVDEYLDSL